MSNERRVPSDASFARCLYTEIKRASLPRLRLYPHPPAVAFDNLFGNGKAGASAGILFAVQPLKDEEDAVEILRLNAYAVVLDREHPFAVHSLCRDMDTRRFFPAELHGIA